MANTPNFALPYQLDTDPPDGPDLGSGIALGLDVLLSRALPKANAAARLALTGAAVYEGLIVRQRDDGSGWIWTDLGAWQQIWGASVGGGGSILQVVTYSATATQTFATTATEYPVAFGVGTDAGGVVRSTKGVGHQFTCAPGTYLIVPTVRFAAGAAGSRFIGLRTADDATEYGSAQNDGGPAAATRTLSQAVTFNASTAVYIVASQSSGGSLATQPSSGRVSVTFTRLG